METVQFPSKTCRNYYLYFQKWMKDHSSLLMSATFPSITTLPQNKVTCSPVAICHLSFQILTAVRIGMSKAASTHPPLCQGDLPLHQQGYLASTVWTARNLKQLVWRKTHTNLNNMKQYLVSFSIGKILQHLRLYCEAIFLSSFIAERVCNRSFLVFVFKTHKVLCVYKIGEVLWSTSSPSIILWGGIAQLCWKEC